MAKHLRYNYRVSAYVSLTFFVYNVHKTTLIVISNSWKLYFTKMADNNEKMAGNNEEPISWGLSTEESRKVVTFNSILLVPKKIKTPEKVDFIPGSGNCGMWSKTAERYNQSSGSRRYNSNGYSDKSKGYGGARE